ncbi:MAG: hypothetical protein HY840_03180 [Bacteroidetes bacterium]|nr:hypothetical protein [Bacteroidota bacterium]
MMKKSFQIIFFSLLSFSAFAQVGTDTVAKKEKKWNTNIFISGGVNATQYSSDKFFNYMDDKTGFPVRINGASKGYPYYNYEYHTIEGGVKSNNIIYDKFAVSSIIDLGLDVSSIRDKKMIFHHIIQASYLQLAGQYSSTTNYSEGMISGSGGWSASVNDSMQAKYTQTIFSLGYKVQPTYKFIFFSLGINCSVNLIRIQEHQRDYINGVSELANFPPVHYYSGNGIIDSSSNFHFINFPLQLGAGGYIKLNRIILKPAFYFTPSFMKGYNFYSVSLGIGYSLKK